MQVALLTEPKTLEIAERERPDPADDEVLVRIEHVGICGSDIHYYEHGRIGDYVVDYPLVLGHETAGEIVSRGSAVDDLEAGDRVALEPGVPCRHCEYCRRGEYHLCGDLEFMATPPTDGAFAEYVTWPADFAYKLPSGVSTLEGAMAEPLSVGLQACDHADVSTGDSVFIAGAGPIGLVAMLTARAAGATDIVVSDLVPEKLERARRLGADRAIDVRKDDLETALEEYGPGVDVAIDAAGTEPAIQSAIDAVRRGGTVVCLGLADESSLDLDVIDLVLREVSLVGSVRYNNTYEPAVELLADGILDTDAFVDFTAPLEEIESAFERASRPDVVKGVVEL